LWAQRVMAASTTGAAVAVDGKMVDRPVILIARQMLDEAARRTNSQPHP
jgi:citrate lyase subunit beta/citryl-CoA lyase